MWQHFFAFLIYTFILTETRVITQPSLENEGIFVNLIGFESWKPCNNSNLHSNINPSRLRCRQDTNAYHHLTLDVGWGSPVEKSFGSDGNIRGHLDRFEEIVLPIKVSSDASGVRALIDPSTCVNYADGDCLLLNQGEATLELKLSPLLNIRPLSPTPIREFAYSYEVLLQVHGNSSSINDALDSRSEGIDFPCPPTTDSLSTTFRSGEKCEPIVCLCNRTEDSELALRLTLASLQGLGPSCGLFPIEEGIGTGRFGGKVRFSHDNADGSKHYDYNVTFSNDVAEAQDVVDNEGVLQVVVNRIRDSTRHAKKAERLSGNIVICNWDGKVLWDGPSIEGASPFHNTFQIPYAGVDETSPTSVIWTNAAWYYLSDDATLYEYSTRSIPTNGINMNLLRSNLERFSDGNLLVLNEAESLCCQKLDLGEHALLQTLKDYFLPKNTPKEVLEWNAEDALTLLPETLISRAVAPARTRFRERNPGHNVKFAPRGGVSRTQGQKALGREDTEYAILLDYELYTNDFFLGDGTRGYDGLKEKEVDAHNAPYAYNVRGSFYGHENYPFASSILPSVAATKGVEGYRTVSVKVNVLISDKVLTGRHLGNETRIPSTFARTASAPVPEALAGMGPSPFEYQSSRLYCHASQLANAIEVGGVLCNSASSVTLTPENLRGILVCNVSQGIAMEEDLQSQPMSFVHEMRGVFREDIRPRLCTNFTYIVTPRRDAPFPLNQVSSFFYPVDAVLLGGGFCKLDFQYIAPLHPAVTRLNPSRQNISISVGEYKVFCEDGDSLALSQRFARQNEITQNMADYGSVVPPQCDDPADFQCVFAGTNQPYEDIGTATMVIYLGAVVGALTLFALVVIFGAHVHRKRAEKAAVARIMNNK